MTGSVSRAAAPPRPSRLSAAARRRLGTWTQVAALAALTVLLGLALWSVTLTLQARGLATGFGYLWQEAGIGIGETLIRFSPSDTFLRAFVAALLNTLLVSTVSIVAATVIGFAVGLTSLSQHWLPRLVTTAYVDVFRNTPQLLQIIVWYSIARNFPAPRTALQPVTGVFLSNRGVQIPWFDPAAPWPILLGALGAGVAAALLWPRLAAAQRRRTARRLPVWPTCLVLVAGIPLLAWLAAGQPALMQTARLVGFNFQGGLALSPEFIALFLGLSLYIGAFIAEIVRGALQGLDRGQSNAARALGMRTDQVYRYVLVPQAMRVMLPPLAAQYISLIKNSSLAVAIGYPDVVNISKTTINQTGNVVEAILLMSAVYLVISFVIAALTQLWERNLQSRIAR